MSSTCVTHMYNICSFPRLAIYYYYSLRKIWNETVFVHTHTGWEEIWYIHVADYMND